MKRFRLLFFGSTLAVLVGCSKAPEVVFEAPPLHEVHSSSMSDKQRTSESSVVAMPTSERPRSVLIRVPFTVQAPLANWGDPYQEACEEASLLMVHHFLQGTALTPEIADREILNIVDWETSQGYSHDVTIAELAQIAHERYGYTSILHENPTADDLRALVASGTPVIVPAAGRDLGNPYYSGEGPWYHMLVIIGYDGSTFITNDPGTRRGMEFRYEEETLMSAIHDWTGVKEAIRSGRSVVLTIETRS